MPKEIMLKFPVDLPPETLKDYEVLEKGKEIIVLELLLKEEISQGKAAELLGISRYALLDLMSKYEMSVIDMSIEELKKELNQNIS
ncbi:MAG: UPF0175 family protein [Nitrospirae bacterium]|nr:UPF0175 family protein [Nitrospirota bacterium]